MFKLIGKVIFGLALLFIAYLFFQAGKSAKPTSIDVVNSSNTSQQSTPLQRIAFGSCNRQDKPQGYWELISQTNPDQWLWLGDW